MTLSRLPRLCRPNKLAYLHSGKVIYPHTKLLAGFSAYLTILC